jgi:hypothetical protein
MDTTPSPDPHTLFLLPDLLPPRQRDLTILILADGNRRGAGKTSAGGYAAGARRVVSIAEHLARRGDVAVMVACILSPDNIAKRGDGFFAAVHEEMIQLGVAIETRGALVAAGVRMEVHGDLGPLRARGGRAPALADATLAVAAMTRGVTNPDLLLLLGVGYGPETARELDADILLRTGMEEPGVLRLSGLRTGERIASCALPTLWPDLDPGEVDALLDACKRQATPRLAGGHGTAAIVALGQALSVADLGAPVRVIVPAASPPAAVEAALGSLRSGPRYEIHVVGFPLPGDDGEILSVLAPGQQPPLFTLPDWLPLGHANVHACETGAAGLVEGIRAALRFSAAHPPLLGSDRALPPAGGTAAERGASERDDLADRFTAKMLGWAAAAGILPPGEEITTEARRHGDFERAAAGYALTGFFIHFRVPTEWDPTAERWGERAELTARYMLLVAAGDEGIFDLALDGETPDQRWARLSASARFLEDALRGEGAARTPPPVHGAALLGAIADGWREILARYGGSCHPRVLDGCRAGVASLYDASLAEHRAPGPQTLADRFARSPACIAARAQALAREAQASELLALGYLAEAASAVGAGLLFRTAALAAPAAHVTLPGVALLDETAALLDYHVRLGNDASGFLNTPGGDRDPKENTCTILVPREASGVARAAATVHALATCRRLMGWLGDEVEGHIARTAEAWPSMGAILRRGVFVGRRVYEVGHYTTVSRAAMSAIFDEAEAALG